MPRPRRISAASQPIKFEGLKSDNPLAFRYYNKDQIVLGKRMEDSCARPSATGIPSPGPGTTSSARARSPARGTAGAMTQDAAWAKMDAAFDFFTRLGAPFYCFHDVDAMPTAAEHQGTRREPRDDGRSPREEAGRDRRQAALGHGEPVLPSALHGRRRDQSRIRTSSPSPRRRCVIAWTPPSVSAARTTCCGAAAKATRRCSTPTSSASSPTSAASCSWSSSTSTRSASRARS